MDLFELIDEYPETLGGSLIFLGILLLIIKISSFNNEKLYKKLEKSKFGDLGIWVLIAGLLIPGLKLLFFNSI